MEGFIMAKITDIVFEIAYPIVKENGCEIFSIYHVEKMLEQDVLKKLLEKNVFI